MFSGPPLLFPFSLGFLLSFAFLDFSLPFAFLDFFSSFELPESPSTGPFLMPLCFLLFRGLEELFESCWLYIRLRIVGFCLVSALFGAACVLSQLSFFSVSNFSFKFSTSYYCLLFVPLPLVGHIWLFIDWLLYMHLAFWSILVMTT